MKILKIISFIPFIIYLFIVLFLLIIGENINFLLFIISSLLLFINSYGLIKNQKKWNIVSMISLIIFSIIYIINGFYDYHKFTSTKIAIIIFLFYIIVFLVKRFLDKNTHIDN